MADAVTLTINGRQRTLRAAPVTTLLRLLRDHAGLTAAKESCGQGDCGACVVAMDGRAVNSCLVLAAEAQGADVVTAEGIAGDDREHPLQRSFREQWGFQCGYCTPGMLMSCWTLLEHTPDPTEDDVRDAISGNLCRCTSYRAIVAATLTAAATAAQPVDLPGATPPDATDPAGAATPPDATDLPAPDPSDPHRRGGA